jgi:hypothetical protein
LADLPDHTVTPESVALGELPGATAKAKILGES